MTKGIRAREIHYINDGPFLESPVNKIFTSLQTPQSHKNPKVIERTLTIAKSSDNGILHRLDSAGFSPSLCPRLSFTNRSSDPVPIFQASLTAP